MVWRNLLNHNWLHGFIPAAAVFGEANQLFHGIFPPFLSTNAQNRLFACE
jgi:hypothetical protein